MTSRQLVEALVAKKKSEEKTPAIGTSAALGWVMGLLEVALERPELAKKILEEELTKTRSVV